ncbi:DNA cytosine methyltransferase [Actinomycetospora rhizophila]|uniref:DNA (cytosine-5-)-methyltransferase n=1 Tax=Actinomycetospora rhizophila TaxID=1416876 RepID=A0ABV9Z758_9PSEU
MASEEPSPDVRLVDLFAGPGGLDVAATWLGIRALGVEWDDDACATREAAGLLTVSDDVRRLVPSDLPTATILTAGPPCQTFTIAGAGNGRRALQKVLAMIGRLDRGENVKKDLGALDDERTGLVLEPLRWLLEAERAGHPYEAVVLEQVPAVLPVWKSIEIVLNRHGYHTDVGVLGTEEYGVPQTRRRALLLAHRRHRPRLPSPTHRAYRRGVARDQGDDQLQPWETMSGVVARASDFVAVSNYGTNGDPADRGRRSSEEPAATITGKVGRVRLEGEGISGTAGRLSPAEAGRLQTFPLDYPWSGKNQGQQIGNAIPPRLGAHALAAVLGLTLPPALLDNCVNESWSPEVREGTLDRLLPRPVRDDFFDRSSEPTLFSH